MLTVGGMPVVVLDIYRVCLYKTNFILNDVLMLCGVFKSLILHLFDFSVLLELQETQSLVKSGKWKYDTLLGIMLAWYTPNAPQN